MYKLLPIFIFLVLCSCKKEVDENENTEGYTPPPPYETGDCMFEGDHAYFTGHVIDGQSGIPLNNYRISHLQNGFILHTDTVVNFQYTIGASNGYFYNGCSFDGSMPDTIHVDLKDNEGNLHEFWFLSDTLILGDTVSIDFTL